MIKGGLVIPDIHVPFGRVPLTIGVAGPEPGEIASSQEAVRKSSPTRIRSPARLQERAGRRSPGAIESDGPAGSDPRTACVRWGRRAPDRCRKGQVQYAVSPLSEDHRRSRHRPDRDLSAGTWSGYRHVHVRPQKQPAWTSLAALVQFPGLSPGWTLSTIARRVSL